VGASLWQVEDADHRFPVQESSLETRGKDRKKHRKEDKHKKHKKKHSKKGKKAARGDESSASSGSVEEQIEDAAPTSSLPRDDWMSMVCAPSTVLFSL
jgi:hypothetical protein